MIQNSSRHARRLLQSLLLASLLCLVCGHVAAQDANVCDQPGESPDVIVGGIIGTARWGTVDNITAFSIGTESCNIGTCWLNWFAGTPEHPVIGQNMFRLRNGRFEQIGQSWLKHGFIALSEDLCSQDCVPTDGVHLGVNCSDPYWAGLNGGQSGLGPKFEVNAWTGVFPDPATDLTLVGDAIYKRLQVRNGDLNPALNPGASYFVEGQYVTADDAAAGNQHNNASYRPIVVVENSGIYQIGVTGTTQREQPGIEAWAAADPGVQRVNVDVPGDGRLLIASRATDQGGGYWHYEYAVQNLNSDRAAGSFTIPIPAHAHVTNIGFHDVEYHSGEPFDGTDWTVTVLRKTDPNTITWSTQSFQQNPDANALRWGTLYNFRFDANAPPSSGSATIGLFKPGAPAAVLASIVGPDPCNADGICNEGETCSNCPGDCSDQGGSPSCCGNGTCEAGESPCGCEADCGPCVPTCVDAVECDDGIFCNGIELCLGNQCLPGDDPCPGQLCDEGGGVCFDCVIDEHCDDAEPCNGLESCAAGVCVAGTELCPDDGLFCNGTEGCFAGDCAVGPDPCPDQQCEEATQTCFECNVDAHCDDGLFCNGVETCVDEMCVPGTDPCNGEPCDDGIGDCLECVVDEECDDGLFCNGVEICLFPGVCIPAYELPCPGFCDETDQECIGNVIPQSRPGDPLPGLTAAQQQRFDDGRARFETVLDEPGGLGPVYNATSCASCHTGPAGGPNASLVTHFGFRDAKSGDFDPLTALGGSLMQQQALSAPCAESIPPEANATVLRATNLLLGAGLVEAVDDTTIEERELNPPAGISGRAHLVTLLEPPGVLRVGRLGWKAGSATVLSASAQEALDQLGLTNRLLGVEHAPNGDAVLLAQCDAQADPEDGPDAGGLDFIDRVTDYVRYLAPPPQTPRSGMSGENFFGSSGCGNCHVGSFISADDPSLEEALRNRDLRPYSDFLLHDMGSGSDGMPHKDAAGEEMRTAPLWGLRLRDALWHDGRFSGGTFESRVIAAIGQHNVPGSEAAFSAQSFLGLPQIWRDSVIDFLGSLGRVEFDHDGDGDVDGDDRNAFELCRTGPGSFYTADDPCAVSDIDQDGDVDDDDFDLFALITDIPAGSIPDGSAVPGPPLRVDKAGPGQITLSWSGSCLAGDTDYGIYEGVLGDFAGHQPATCSTAGATSATFAAPAGNVYYLVVPGNGIREGAYGRDGQGNPRSQGPTACLPQSIGVCE